jgi:hypothetical protein
MRDANLPVQKDALVEEPDEVRHSRRDELKRAALRTHIEALQRGAFAEVEDAELEIYFDGLSKIA